MFVRACPRPMHNVLCAGTIEARALWIRTRESGISLRRWRRLCHGGPPVVRNGPKDTDLTPVAPRYCSPGLPGFTDSELRNAVQLKEYTLPVISGSSALYKPETLR